MKKETVTREEIKKKIQAMSEEELVDLYIKENWLEEQVENLRKLRFGSTSEKIIAGQLNLFNEVEDLYDHSDYTDDGENDEEAQPKKRKKKSREADFSNLSTTVIHHTLEDQRCEECGTLMKELAPQIVDVLKYQPARYTVERHIIHQYVCPQCSEENLASEIIAAPGAPKRLIPGSKTSPSVVAGILFNKFVSGIPLYRQEQELHRKKIEISRMTMSNWLMKCAEYIEPLYQQMHQDLQTLRHIHMDETTVTVLEDKKNGRQKSYMWVAVSGKFEQKQMALYYYDESRETAVAKEVLDEDYSGGLHCDGYDAYSSFKQATILGCFAHCRRYFIEALEVSPLHQKAKKLKGKALAELCEEHPGYGNLVKVVNTIRYLFNCEKKYIEERIDPEAIRQRRQAEQKSKLEELFATLESLSGSYLEKSKAGKAITYALNQKQVLMNYLDDGEAENSNNRAERAVKPFVIGRKAWLFSNTKSGARMSSIYYSVVESAKLNHLDIHRYLDFVFTQIQDHRDTVDIQTLLPYSKNLPDSLRVR